MESQDTRDSIRELKAKSKVSGGSIFELILCELLKP